MLHQKGKSRNCCLYINCSDLPIPNVSSIDLLTASQQVSNQQELFQISTSFVLSSNLHSTMKREQYSSQRWCLSHHCSQKVQHYNFSSWNLRCQQFMFAFIPPFVIKEWLVHNQILGHCLLVSCCTFLLVLLCIMEWNRINVHLSHPFC